jgi:hypothetical protein
MFDYTNFNIKYLQNGDYEAVIFKNNYDLSWDTSYSYFVENKWTISNFSGVNNCWIRKLSKNGEPAYLKQKQKQKQYYKKYEPILYSSVNTVEWTKLRLKRLKHLIDEEALKSTILESFGCSYEEIKKGLRLLNIDRKQVSIKAHREQLQNATSIDKHN